MLRSNIGSVIKSRMSAMTFGSIWRPILPAVQSPGQLYGQIRGKRTKKSAGGRTPGALKLITMLSVFTARKKLPRRLKLSVEDLIRHNTVQAAWKYFMRDKKRARIAQLKAQYEKIQEACNEIEQLDGFLAYHATMRERGKRFTPELRIPTETPPRQIWSFDWKPSDRSVPRS